MPRINVSISLQSHDVFHIWHITQVPLRYSQSNIFHNKFIPLDRLQGLDTKTCTSSGNYLYWFPFPALNSFVSTPLSSWTVVPAFLFHTIHRTAKICTAQVVITWRLTSAQVSCCCVWFTDEICAPSFPRPNHRRDGIDISNWSIPVITCVRYRTTMFGLDSRLLLKLFTQKAPYQRAPGVDNTQNFMRFCSTPRNNLKLMNIFYKPLLLTLTHSSKIH